jgi:hypothetical protein
MNKPIARLKTEREKTQINMIRNERGMSLPTMQGQKELQGNIENCVLISYHMKCSFLERHKQPNLTPEDKKSKDL